ncbi:MAG: Hsp33 family molecular chaperone HslO [Woeseiaceae bacterium]
MSEKNTDDELRADALVRFMFNDIPVRGVLLQFSKQWQALNGLHDYPTPVRDLLGQAVAAVTSIASSMKFEGMLTVQLSGQGALPMLIVQCNDKLQFRGMASDVEQSPVPTVFSGLMSAGQLSLTVDALDAKDRYRGIVSLGASSLAGCLKDYYAESAQLEAHFVLFGSRERACALMLQRMPDREPMADDDWHRLCLMADTLSADELREGVSHTLIHRLFSEDDVVAWPAASCAFSCRCDDHRAEQAVKVLGEADALLLLAERDNKIEITCEFCRKVRVLDEIDVGRLFNPAAVPGQSGIH